MAYKKQNQKVIYCFFFFSASHYADFSDSHKEVQNVDLYDSPTEVREVDVSVNSGLLLKRNDSDNSYGLPVKHSTPLSGQKSVVDQKSIESNAPITKEILSEKKSMQ